MDQKQGVGGLQIQDRVSLGHHDVFVTPGAADKDNLDSVLAETILQNNNGIFDLDQRFLVAARQTLDTVYRTQKGHPLLVAHIEGKGLVLERSS